MKYQITILKLRFYAYYRLHYYIAGIPYALAWHSSLWSAGMAIMPMYIRVTYQKIGIWVIYGNLIENECKYLISYSYCFRVAKLRSLVSQEIPNCRPQFSKINIVNQGQR